MGYGTLPASAADAAGGKVAISANASNTVAGTIVWAPQQAGGVFYSNNRGLTWAKAGNNIPNLIDGNSVFADYSVPLAADRNQPNTFYAYKNGVLYRSTTQPPNFVVVPTPVDGPGTNPNTALPSNGAPFLRTIYDSRPSVAKSWVGISLNAAGLYLSQNYGATRTFTKAPGVDRAVAFDFGKPMTTSEPPAIYVWGIVNGVRGIFRSRNGGNTWDAIHNTVNVGGAERAVNFGNTVNSISLTADKQNAGRVYIGTQSGFFYGDGPLSVLFS